LSKLGKGNVTHGHRRNAIIRCLSDSAHNDSWGVSKFGALGTARSLRTGSRIADEYAFPRAFPLSAEDRLLQSDRFCRTRQRAATRSDISIKRLFFQ